MHGYELSILQGIGNALKRSIYKIYEPRTNIQCNSIKPLVIQINALD